jgi:hypothetical protein
VSSERIFSVAMAIAFYLLPYAGVKDMPPFVAWIGIFGALLIGALTFVPMETKLFWPVSLIIAGTLCFMAGSVWLYQRIQETPQSVNAVQETEPPSSTILAMRLNVRQFLTESPSGTYKLYLNLKALETVDLTRITVLFNHPGGNGAYQLADCAACPRHMLFGEELDLVLIHYRPNIGTFWGDLDRVTERLNLDHLNSEERRRHCQLSLDAGGPYYYCLLIAQHTRGEEPIGYFTVLIPSRSERPGIVTGGTDHKDYDPKRFIPATGTFLE